MWLQENLLAVGVFGLCTALVQVRRADHRLAPRHPHGPPEPWEQIGRYPAPVEPTSPDRGSSWGAEGHLHQHLRDRQASLCPVQSLLAWWTEVQPGCLCVKDPAAPALTTRPSRWPLCPHTGFLALQGSSASVSGELEARPCL